MVAEGEATTTRTRVLSVALSVAALVILAAGMLLSWSRVAVLALPVILGVIALVLAFRARWSVGARPGPAVTFLLAAVAIIAPALTVIGVILAGVFAPSASYTLTVDSPEPVTVIIRDGADSTTEQWSSGRSIRLGSSQGVVGIDARASEPTTVISCELVRDGRTISTDERAGSVDCSYNAGRN